MDRILQYILIACSLGFCIFILRKTHKKNLSYKNSLLWLAFGVITMLCAIFPNIVVGISNFLHIAEPTNALFLIYIFLMIVVAFYITMIISKLSEKVTTLVQANALLHKKIDKLEEEIKNGRNN